MIKTDGFATTRANTPISTVKNMDGNIQVFRLPLELEYWVFSCKRAASVEKILSLVKLFLESLTINFMWSLNRKEDATQFKPHLP